MLETYLTWISIFVAFLRQYKLFLPANILGTFLTEPLCALYLGLIFPIGYIEPFTFDGLNPRVHDKTKPVLLLHGNHSNQSAWLSFAKAFKKEGQWRVYTINLPSNQITEEEILRVGEKLDEIGGVVDLVGHSRGGHVAHLVASKYPEKIGKIITLGSPLTAEEIAVKPVDNVYEIIAQYDVLNPRPSLLPPEKRLEIKTGHLGLLFSTDAEMQVMRWLQLF